MVYWAEKHGYHLVSFLETISIQGIEHTFPEFKAMLEKYRGIVFGTKDGIGHAFAKVSHMIYNPTDGEFHPLSIYDEYTDRGFLAWVNKPATLGVVPWQEVFA